MKALIAAISFLTRLPVPSTSISTKDWQKSATYYPLVGLIIGSILAVAAFIAHQWLPFTVGSIVVLCVWVWVTGGLHLDGWMDLADGIGSSRSKDEMLAIMKDSRVGAMGVIAAILLLMVKAAAIYEIMTMNSGLLLILPPLIARFILLFAIKFFPYTKDGGIGTGLKDQLTYVHILLASIGVVILIFIAFPTIIFISLILSIVAATLFLYYVCRRLGGLNGDTYGAAVEFTEAVSLVSLIFIWGN